MNFYDPASTSRVFSTYTDLNGIRLFSYGLILPFALNESGRRSMADPLFSVWSIVEEALGQEAILDQGWAKARGEFLAYGAAYAPAGLMSQPVSARISIGSLDKQLAVFGDRRFSAMNMAGPPLAFSRMPITASTAFGGEQYPANPLGKGASELIDEVSTTRYRPLPNVERVAEMMISPRDTPEPAGFWGIPSDSPLRARYLGKFNKAWLKNRWPHVPADTDQAFFQAAPRDQQLETYFKGDERISLRNMHPSQALIQSALPGLRARIFFEQQHSDGINKFIESQARPETVWLLPDQGCGLILFRATISTAHPAAQDIKSVYSALEPLSDTPGSHQDHFQRFQAITEPEKNLALQVHQQALAEAEAQAATLQAEAVILQAELDQLKAMTPAQKADRVKKELIESFKEDFTAPSDEQKQAIDLLRTELAKIESTLDAAKQSNIPGLDQTKLSELNALLSKAKVAHENLIMQFASPQARMLAHLAENPNNSKLVQQLKDAPGGIDNLFENIDPILDEMLKAEFEYESDAPESEKSNEISDDAEQARIKTNQKIRDQLLQYQQTGESLSDLQLFDADLTDLDLQGMDFTGLILAGTNFNRANLRGAKFDQAILSEASFNESILLESSFKSASANKASFKSCNMSHANLYAADFSDADFSGANLHSASLTHANFSDAKLVESDLSECYADYVTFNGCNMRGAKLTNVRFGAGSCQKTLLLNADLSNAIFMHADFCGANLSYASLVNARLENSQADASTQLIRTNLTGADMTRASWLGSVLEAATLNDATLNDMDLSNSQMPAATMIRAIAKGANLSGTNLEGADLSAINLFQGSLANANLNKCKLDIANLYGVDFLDSNWQQASIANSIISRTLVSLRQTN